MAIGTQCRWKGTNKISGEVKTPTDFAMRKPGWAPLLLSTEQQRMGLRMRSDLHPH